MDSLPPPSSDANPICIDRRNSRRSNRPRDDARDSLPTVPGEDPHAIRGGRARGVLIVTTGNDAGRVIPLDADSMVAVGRSTTCAVHLNDDGLSRVHAHISHFGGDFVFADAHSTNGSRVNRERVGGPVYLRDGDRIQVGTTTTLLFTHADEDEKEALSSAYQGALRDPLTGLFNRRYLSEVLGSELKLAHRRGLDLSVLLLDLDHFKRVNDTFGHLAGDAALLHVARVLSTEVRAEDVIARYGGEEFLILARATPIERASLAAERVRRAIQNSPFRWQDRGVSITASFGVASLRCCSPARDRDALIALADERLYRAKQTRNRVVAG